MFSVLDVIAILILAAMNVCYIIAFIKELRNKKKKMSKIGIVCGVIQIIVGTLAICVLLLTRSRIVYVITAAMLLADSFIQSKYG